MFIVIEIIHKILFKNLCFSIFFGFFIPCITQYVAIKLLNYVSVTAIRFVSLQPLSMQFLCLFRGALRIL